MNIVIVCVLRNSSEKQFDVEHLQYTFQGSYSTTVWSENETVSHLV